MSSAKVKLIHHGGAMKQRRIEMMIKMMQYLDNEKYELTLMLVPGDQKYYAYLTKMAGKFKNIKIVNPVGFSKIPETINKHDVGVYILRPDGFNDKYALPNKIFEFIQARLAIAIGPSIEMAKIVNKYHVGVVSKDFSAKSLADSIRTLSWDSIMEYKGNSDKYAKELSSENNMTKIKRIVSNLTGDN
jgi:hypothetical protein